MTINIYASERSQKAIERHQWVGGTVDGFLRSYDIDCTKFDVQPVRVFVNLDELHPEQWAVYTVKKGDRVDIYPKQFGFVGKAIGKVFNFAFGWLMPKVPTARQRVDNGQGRQLSSAESQANVAKLNATVPETFGTMLRYPDYLTHPVRRFEDERTQVLEMLLCIGPGEYQTQEPKIGNTPISQVPDAVYRVYPPNADLSGIVAAENWYPAPEVGSTSGGTSGLELTSSPTSGLVPTGTSFTLDGADITSIGAEFPETWRTGVTMQMAFAQPVTITQVDINTDPLLDPVLVNELQGDWSELQPSVGMLVRCSGVYTGQARIAYVDGDIIRLEEQIDDEWRYVSDLPTGVQSLSITEDGRTYRIESKTGDTVTFSAPLVSGWTGFVARTVQAAEAEWIVNGSNIQGEAAGPFVLIPVPEKTSSFELDFFFPRGLHKMNQESGALENQSVTVEIDYRDASVTGSPWTTIQKVYTGATLDQIGYTERIDTPTPIRPEVLVRRIGARSTSSSVNDEVQWYGARCLLRTPTSYPWTTMAVNVRGLGKISSSSENRVNLVVTRRLPELQPDGSWSAPVPTRDISAAVRHICESVGYGLDHIDMVELQRLHELWTQRYETFDATLDETTAQQALEVALAAGMAELTIEDGLVRPVREGIRRFPEQVYSAQNTTREISRQFTAPRHDDKDGVEVEYQDEQRGWAADTIKCVLPGSPGAKLEKIKLQGVTNRTRAWRIGMRRAREIRYQRWQYTFGTELDAWNSTYGGFVQLVGDQAALLKDIQPIGSNGRYLLTVSEPLRWRSGESHVIAIRRPDGTATRPLLALAGDAPNQVIATIQPEDVPTVTMRQELPHVFFGPETGWRWDAIIKSVRMGSNDQCTVQAVNYDDRIYADDDSGPFDVVLTSKVYRGVEVTSKVYMGEEQTSLLYPLNDVIDALGVQVTGVGAQIRDIVKTYEIPAEAITSTPTGIGAALVKLGYEYQEGIASVPTLIGVAFPIKTYSYTEQIACAPHGIGALAYVANTNIEPDVLTSTPSIVGAQLY